MSGNLRCESSNYIFFMSKNGNIYFFKKANLHLKEKNQIFFLSSIEYFNFEPKFMKDLGRILLATKILTFIDIKNLETNHFYE
jgi:hypothetical protein